MRFKATYPGARPPRHVIHAAPAAKGRAAVIPPAANRAKAAAAIAQRVGAWVPGSRGTSPPSVLSRTPGAIFLVGSNRFVNPRPSVRTPNPFIIQRYLVSPHQGGLPAPREQPVTAPPAGPRVSARPRHHGQPVPTPT